MKKSTKGALAAAAAGTLLLGGAGSLAFWSENTTVDGGDLASGSITLSSVTCAPNFTHTEDLTTVTNIVPGDTITKQCTGTLTLVGDHIGAGVEIDPLSIQSLDGSLGSEVEAEAVLVDPAGGAITAEGTYDITVDINVTFPTTVTSESSQTSTASLNALTLVATQTHN